VEQLSVFVVALTAFKPYALCTMLNKHLFFIIFISQGKH